MSIDNAFHAATRAMCEELYGKEFDLHEHGAEDPEGRAGLERAAGAAIRAYLRECGGGNLADIAKAAARAAVAASAVTGRPVDPRVKALAES